MHTRGTEAAASGPGYKWACGSLPPRLEGPIALGVALLELPWRGSGGSSPCASTSVSGLEAQTPRGFHVCELSCSLEGTCHLASSPHTIPRAFADVSRVANAPVPARPPGRCALSSPEL